MWGPEPAILVVDDDRGCRELHAQWLSSSYTVRTAAGGREALEAIDRTIDLVLLDWVMPVLDGEAVLSELDERGFDVDVVVVSGVETDTDLSALPVADYLVKPISRSELLSTVEQLRTRASLGELFSLAVRKARLESQKSSRELEASEEYRRLEQALSSQREAVRSMLSQSDLDWGAAFELCRDPFRGTDPGHEF